MCFFRSTKIVAIVTRKSVFVRRLVTANPIFLACLFDKLLIKILFLGQQQILEKFAISENDSERFLVTKLKKLITEESSKPKFYIQMHLLVQKLLSKHKIEKVEKSKLLEGNVEFLIHQNIFQAQDLENSYKNVMHIDNFEPDAGDLQDEMLSKDNKIIQFSLFDFEILYR